MPQGIIIKGIGGFYYVKTEKGTLECRARGKFRNEKLTPLVGDIVHVIEQNGGCVIDKIEPRKTELKRPPVANVDQAIIVLAADRPKPDFHLLDKFLLLSEYNRLYTVICINKIDLTDISEAQDIVSPYKDGGYEIIYTSTLTGYGIKRLKEVVKDRVTVLAGPSGVGKSSIMNCLGSSFNVKTGEISGRIGRGKNTTRHSELLEIESGGYVVDTPGFSSLDVSTIDIERIDGLFPEIRNYIGLCRFSGCSHISEPGCAVKDALYKNEINPIRYDSYVRLYNEIKKTGRNYK